MVLVILQVRHIHKPEIRFSLYAHGHTDCKSGTSISFRQSVDSMPEIRFSLHVHLIMGIASPACPSLPVNYLAISVETKTEIGNSLRMLRVIQTARSTPLSLSVNPVLHFITAKRAYSLQNYVAYICMK